MTASVRPDPLPPVCILAGGLGTRLGEWTRGVPKPLVAVAGKPFIFHQFELLRRHGAVRVVLCVGYRGEQIEAAVGNGEAFGLDVSYSYDGPSVIGTGAALRQALPLLDGEFLVLYGDTYLRIDYRAVVDAFRRSGLPALMTVLHNEGRWEASNAAFDGRLVRYRRGEAGFGMEWIDYGLSVMTRRALELAPSDEADLSKIFGWLSAQGFLAGFPASERFYDIGTPQALAETADFLSRLGDQVGHGRS